MHVYRLGGPACLESVGEQAEDVFLVAMLAADDG